MIWQQRRLMLLLCILDKDALHHISSQEYSLLTTKSVPTRASCHTFTHRNGTIAVLYEKLLDIITMGVWE